MSDGKAIPPSFAQRAAATWIDFVMLLGCYLVLGYLSNDIFRVEAYPRPSAMQLYSRRDFEVFGFFVYSTLILTTLYLGLCYGISGATIGQRLARVRLLNEDGNPLKWGNIVKRIFTVLFRLFLIFIPGPLAAIAFLSYSYHILNPAFSMALLVAALLFLLYVSIVRYNRGHTRSMNDHFSGTILVRLDCPPKSEVETGGASPAAKPAQSPEETTREETPSKE